MENKKATFNWGWGIFAFFTCFVGFMIFMVYKTTTVNPELVTSDYYQQEIDFQQKIDKRNNLIATGKHMEIKTYDKVINVNLPAIKDQSPSNAKIYFYRASDKSKDISLTNKTGGAFSIPKKQLIKGEYILKAEWECDGKFYYEETNFTMP